MLNSLRDWVEFQGLWGFRGIKVWFCGWGDAGFNDLRTLQWPSYDITRRHVPMQTKDPIMVDHTDLD